VLGIDMAQVAFSPLGDDGNEIHPMSGKIPALSSMGCKAVFIQVFFGHSKKWFCKYQE